MVASWLVKQTSFCLSLASVLVHLSPPCTPSPLVIQLEHHAVECALLGCSLSRRDQAAHLVLIPCLSTTLPPAPSPPHCVLSPAGLSCPSSYCPACLHGHYQTLISDPRDRGMDRVTCSLLSVCLVQAGFMTGSVLCSPSSPTVLDLFQGVTRGPISEGREGE